ncbi:MAG: Uma2 family endonuclease [Gemmataceae bacterium]
MICDTTIPTGAYSVRGADLCYFSFNRLSKETPTQLGAADVPPELVIEVRPPSNTLRTVIKKVDDYLEAGVDVVVLLEPAAETATVFRKGTDQQLSGDEVLTLPDILPGFSVPVRKFFE